MYPLLLRTTLAVPLVVVLPFTVVEVVSCAVLNRVFNDVA